MTFARFTGAANRRIQTSAAKLRLPLTISRDAIVATWESGQRRVIAYSVGSDLARVQFLTDGALDVEIRGWLRSPASARELAGAVLAFFEGRGAPTE